MKRLLSKSHPRSACPSHYDGIRQEIPVCIDPHVAIGENQVMVRFLIRGLMLSVFLIGPFAQSERTAIGLDGKPPEQKTNDEQTNPVDANAPKITQTDYFGAEGSDERNKEVREFTELYQKFANNPKIKGSQKAVEHALAFYVKNKDGVSKSCKGSHPGMKIRDDNWVVVTDYTKGSDTQRMHMLNLKTGEVITTAAAHGYGSSKDLKNCPKDMLMSCRKKGRTTRCKIPTKFTDRSGQGTTLRGFFIANGGYVSPQRTFRAGRPPHRPGTVNALDLDGVQEANKGARGDRKVFHRASYVGKDKVNACSFSAGCPSISPEIFEKLKGDLKSGSLFYNHTIVEDKLEKPEC